MENRKRKCKKKEEQKTSNNSFTIQYSRSVLVAGGFLVAQFVLIDLDPNHWPFIAVIALSASCNGKKRKGICWKMVNDVVGESYGRIEARQGYARVRYMQREME